MSRCHNYCFTHNNYADTTLEDNIDCQYIVYGKEIGASGTPHLQGFIRFNAQKSLKQAIKALPGCHVEVANTFQAAMDYCKKDGDYVERGTAPLTQAQKGAGEKRRWDDILLAAQEGRFEDIDPKTRVTQCRNLEFIRSKALRDRALVDTEEKHYWYHGATGTGKSRRAREENPDAYLKCAANKWWDGYVDQDTVIIEDFDKYHVKQGYEMKLWADRYPFPAETKGGSMIIRPKKIIVTSNYHPKDIWEDNGTLLPILRRFRCVDFDSLKPSC